MRLQGGNQEEFQAEAKPSVCIKNLYCLCERMRPFLLTFFVVSVQNDADRLPKWKNVYRVIGLLVLSFE